MKLAEKVDYSPKIFNHYPSSSPIFSIFDSVEPQKSVLEVLYRVYCTFLEF